MPYRILAGKSGGNTPLGRTRLRWEDNLIIDLRNVEWGGKDLI
jgi:hypothetical protein